MMAPVSRSCHATCCGLGFTSTKFCASENVAQRTPRMRIATMRFTFNLTLAIRVRTQTLLVGQFDFLCNCVIPSVAVSQAERGISRLTGPAREHHYTNSQALAGDWESSPLTAHADPAKRCPADSPGLQPFAE